MMKVVCVTVLTLFLAVGAFAQSSYEEELKMAQDLLEEGKKYYAAGNYLTAIQSLRQAIDNNPDLWEAYYLLGACYENRMENLDAVDSYENALEINPEIQGLEEHLNKLRFEEQTGQTYYGTGTSAAQARDYVEKGKELWDAGRAEEAAAQVGIALRLNPALPEANFAAGYIYQQQGALTNAEKFYQAAINIKPDYKEALNNLGLVHMAQGYYVKALYDFSRVIELEYTYMAAYYNRAGAYAAQYNYETAIKEMVKVIAQDDLDVEAHNNLALYYERDGDITGAMKEWRRVLELVEDAEARKKMKERHEGKSDSWLDAALAGVKAQAEEHLGKMAVYEEEATALALARANRVRRWRASLSVGWAQSGMADFDSEIVRVAEEEAELFIVYLASWGEEGTVTTESSPSTGGLDFGVDVGYMVTSRVGVGIRERITMLRDSEVHVLGAGELSERLEYRMGVDANLICVMFGGWLELGSQEKVICRVAAYGGPMYAGVKFRNKWSVDDPKIWPIYYPPAWGHGKASGSGIACEGRGELGIPLGKHLFGFLELGYRAANVGAMTYTWDVDEYDDPDDDKDGGNNFLNNPMTRDADIDREVDFDFSGLVFSAGFRLSM